MKVTRLQQLHRYSGIMLAVFFLFHIINHLCAMGGADQHIRVMKLFRIVYRFPPVEAILLLSALVQVVSGPVLIWKRKFTTNGFDLLQVTSGLYLSFFLFYHIRAVMLGRYVWKVETDFHFAASGVKHSPDDRFFIPYYSLSILCVFIHLACVHRRKMIALHEAAGKVGESHRLAGRQAMGVIVAGTVVTVAILVSFIKA